jgi:hypothetical protein
MNRSIKRPRAGSIPCRVGVSRGSGLDEELVDSLDVLVMVDLVSALSDRYLSRLVSVKDDDWDMTTVAIDTS